MASTRTLTKASYVFSDKTTNKIYLRFHFLVYPFRFFLFLDLYSGNARLFRMGYPSGSVYFLVCRLLCYADRHILSLIRNIQISVAVFCGGSGFRYEFAGFACFR